MTDFEKACSKQDKRYTGETMQENVVEFLKNSRTATVCFCQGKFITRIRDYAEKYPDECQVVSDTADGIVAHIPTKWLHITRHSGREMTEEEKAAAAERMKKMREARIG